MNKKYMRKMDDNNWWKKTTVYQIYPRSYKDSTGNGIGDLKGIISQLDYIKELGVETIWFSPFYTSPQADFGYDIGDYISIAPEYGTMDTCDELIEEIHKRDMKIVLDMVMNHTSDQHAWFKESRSSKDNPKRDWYIWKDGKNPNGKAPPNNWKAMITGCGWHYDETTEQWYWAQFLPFQPDLNYRNPEVKAAMFDIVRFWLKKKVDGFRLDILNAVYEDAEFRDNPLCWTLIPSDESDGVLFRSSKHTLNHPDTFEFAKELRSVIDEFNNPSRYLVGEVQGPLTALKEFCGEKKPDGLNSVFLFKTLGAKLKAKTFRKLITEFEEHFADPYIPTWVFANHDRFRRISRLGNNVLKAKLNTALQLTVRGVPYIYYGEEIGMPQHNIPIKKSLDAVAMAFKWIPQWVMNIVKKLFHESINRDECRTPMQWTPEPNAGFCLANVKPWLPVTDNYKEKNVETQQQEPDSLYNCYKRFLEVRKKYDALNSGSISLFDEEILPKNVLAYKRTAESGEKVYVILNFNKIPITMTSPIENGKLIVSTTIDTNFVIGDELKLGPYEAIVIEQQ
jgi:glycosidase